LIHGLFGGNRQDIPFPVIKNWRRELIPHLEKAHHDLSWASEVQTICLRWWTLYLGNLRSSFRYLLDTRLLPPSLQHTQTQDSSNKLGDPHYISPDLLQDSFAQWQHLLS